MSHGFFEILIFRNSSSFSIFGGSLTWFDFERTNDRSQKRIFTDDSKNRFSDLFQQKSKNSRDTNNDDLYRGPRINRLLIAENPH